jgi:hypothetical protein
MDMHKIWTYQIVKQIFDIPDFKEFQQKYDAEQRKLRRYLLHITYRIDFYIPVAIEGFCICSQNSPELWICLINFRDICRILENNIFRISKFLYICKQHAIKYYELNEIDIKQFIHEHKLDFSVPTQWTLPDTFMI